MSVSKFIEIKEFDIITCNPIYRESSLTYVEQWVFDKLEDFILTTYQRNQENANFFNIRMKKNIGKVIQVKNYVGLIQLDCGYQIQILPKVITHDTELIKKTFIQMLQSLKNFPCQHFNAANLRVERMSIYEIFINMYIQELELLLKKGIKSCYLNTENNQNYYKGKLLINEHVKNNLVNKHQFYVSYDEFEINRPENRLIKSTLMKLSKESTSHKNKKKLMQLLIHFDAVSPSKCYSSDFSKVRLDRTTQIYSNLIEWSKVFLMNKSFSTFSGGNNMQSLLFPMEKLFESYVAQQLRKVLYDLPWDIDVQGNGYYLFDEPKKFALKPDIVITKECGHKIILDTKWKQLINDSRRNYGISQSDMYQMYAYSKKYETPNMNPEIWLLYPLTEESKELKNIEYISNDGVSVHVFFVDIVNITKSLNELKEILLETSEGFV